MGAKVKIKTPETNLLIKVSWVFIQFYKLLEKNCKNRVLKTGLLGC